MGTNSGAYELNNGTVLESLYDSRFETW